MHTNLPSSRQIFTSLINSLSHHPLPTEKPSASQSNALASTPDIKDRRSLLLTLHVLFPDLVLPALDLLDRGLVTRHARSDPVSADALIATQVPSSHNDGAGNGPNVVDSHIDQGARVTANAEPEQLNTRAQHIPTSQSYTVRSLASTLKRRGRESSTTSRIYIIHLDAWNCSCANFTLDAFPIHSVNQPEMNNSERKVEESDWSFGGLDMQGIARSTEHIPCCKHLLACLLSEKWNGILSNYVEEQTNTREEFAGIVAGV